MNWRRWLFGRREVTLALACVVVTLIFHFLSPYFLTAENLTTILRNSVELLLISLGITFILATAGIDIAVGGALGICAIFVGWSIQGGWPFGVVLLIGPLIGTGLGLISATLIVRGKIPPIIATLGLFGVYRAAIFCFWAGVGFPAYRTRSAQP
jgi:AI-2 transport system permease protein